VDRISDLLVRQLRAYISEIEVSKTRLPYECRVPPLRDVKALVTPYALRKVVEQLVKISDNLEACTDTYTKYSGLPCAHKAKASIESNGGVLKIEDIHPHWRYTKPASWVTRQQIFEVEEGPNTPALLMVQNPVIARTVGRPPGLRELPIRAELEAA